MQDEHAARTTPEALLQPWADRLTVILFSVGIALPFCGYVANVKNFTTTEIVAQSTDVQPLLPLPRWDGGLASLWEIPQQFERHFNGRFGYRSHLVDLFATVKYFGLGDSWHKNAIVGRDGWLFFAWERDGQSARSPRKFSAEELQQWRTVLEARTDWLKQRHCQYLFVIAPEKQSVYPQYLPSWMPTQPSVHDRTVQLMESLREDATVDILDLGDSLRAVAAQERLFHRTDSHWNEYGAFVAYTTIVQQLSKSFPDMVPLPSSRIRRSKNIAKGLDLARMLCLRRALKEESFDIQVVDPQARRIEEKIEITKSQQIEWFEPSVIENVNRKLPKAIVIGDSFSFAMNPWLAEHFSRLVYLPEHALDPQVIEREQPDVVIQEVVERKLFTVVPEDIVCHPGDSRVVRLASEHVKQID